MSFSEKEVNNIKEILSNLAEPLGYEIHTFKVGWYNDTVDSKRCHLNYHPDTVCFLVISQPKMFDLAFKQYLRLNNDITSLDAIDECTKYYLNSFVKHLSNNDIDTIYDYELYPNHRPKILMQTCGHVSGASYYYQRKDVKKDPWPKDKKIFGVSVHPQFGGWFAFRAVMIFRDIQCESLSQTTPLDILDEPSIFNVLDSFNSNWKSCAYRDVLPGVKEKYSQEQIEYFVTPPHDRVPLLSLIRQKLDYLSDDECTS